MVASRGHRVPQMLPPRVVDVVEHPVAAPPAERLVGAVPGQTFGSGVPQLDPAPRGRPRTRRHRSRRGPRPALFPPMRAPDDPPARLIVSGTPDLMHLRPRAVRRAQRRCASHQRSTCSNRAAPVRRAAGAAELVPLAGEQQQLGRHAAALELDEPALSLLHRAPPVVLGVDDERRRRTCAHVRHRRLRGDRGAPRRSAASPRYSRPKNQPMSLDPTKLTGSRNPRSTIAPTNRSVRVVSHAVR